MYIHYIKGKASSRIFVIIVIHTSPGTSHLTGVVRNLERV